MSRSTTLKSAAELARAAGMRFPNESAEYRRAREALLIEEIDRARQHGDTHPEVDAFCSAVFFLLGVYGVLSTTSSQAARDTMLKELVATAVRSLEVR